MILFSVVIPVYNSEKYIKRCLESIYLQKYDNLQIIVIDDGSTDGSKEVVMDYVNKDSRFNYVYENNNGPAVARNLGMRLSRGQYICFVDSDDEIQADYFFELNDVLKNHKVEILEINAGIKLKDGTFRKLITLDKSNVIMSGVDYLVDFLKFHKYFNVVPWTKIMKKSFIMDNNLFFDKRFAEDEVWARKCFVKANKVMFFDKNLYIEHPRIKSQSQKKKLKKNVLDQKNNYRELEKLYKKNPFKKSKKNVIRNELCHGFIAISSLNSDVKVTFADRLFCIRNAKSISEMLNTIVFCISPKLRYFIKNRMLN